jgi:hypothetical protein
MLLMLLTLAACGDDGGSSPVTITTQIISDPAIDGDILENPPNVFTVTQGMSPTVQSVFAGIDPATLAESRAFLHFPLTGAGGVPGNAVIVSAALDIFINNIQPLTGSIPIRIDLVNFQPPTLLATDFDRTTLPALATLSTTIFQSDFNKHVFIDVTVLMSEAQRLGLLNFQIRILEDLGIVSAGQIEINDTTGANRATLAPLLEVTYF